MVEALKPHQTAPVPASGGPTISEPCSCPLARFSRSTSGGPGGGSPGSLGRTPAVDEELLAAAGRQQGQQVRGLRPLDREGMWHVARQEHERPFLRDELVVAAAEPDAPLEHPEGLVLAAVHVQRRRHPDREPRLDQAERAAGRLRRRLHGHPVAEEPRVLSDSGRRCVQRLLLLHHLSLLAQWKLLR